MDKQRYLRFFRECDIRGEYGRGKLDEVFFYSIGKSIAEKYNVKKVLVGYDGKSECKKCAIALIKGLCDTVDVYWGGVLSIPATIYNAPDFDLSLLVTASHLPEGYVGLKTYGSDRLLLRAFDFFEILDLYEYPEGKQAHGEIYPAIEKYMKFCARVLKDVDLESRKLVLGHGFASGKVEYQVFRRIFGDIETVYDENFFLCAIKVRNKVGDRGIGIIFDNDSDRIWIVVDGILYSGDDICSIIAHGRKVVVDYMSSPNALEYMNSKGIETILARTGYLNVRKKCIEVKADIGFEFSGHTCIKEFNYAEMPVVIFKSFMDNLHKIEDLERYARYKDILIMNMLYSRGKIASVLGRRLKEIDRNTFRIVDDDLWIVARPSDTEPGVWRARFGAKDKDMLKKIISNIMEQALPEYVEVYFKY